MKFKVGDKVKFLNDVGEGTIKKIISETLVNVEIEDGFEVPTLIKDLIRIQETDKLENNVNIEDEKDITDKIEDEVNSFFNEENGETILGQDNPDAYLALVPEKKDSKFIDGFELYLINNCNYQILYTLSKQVNNKQEHIDAGILGANTKINFMYISHKDLNLNMSLLVQAIFYQVYSYKEIPPVVKKYSIDPFHLMDENSHLINDFFEEKAIIYNLNENDFKNEINNISKKDIEKTINEKDISDPIKVTPEKTDIEEVDLHIEEIVDNHAGLTNSEIIDIQMSRFKIALEGGIRNNLKKMFFIHGVGNGTLRYEIRKFIDNNYPKINYQDASFKEYGFGATQVNLK